MTTDSPLYDAVIECARQIETKFVNTGALSDVVRTDILSDKEYSSIRYRRAHISIVDARDTKKLYLLHVTVFPHTNDPSPIFGFDIVCGPTKVSGAFHDFSNGGDPTSFMWLWFNAKVAQESWNKPREIPEWGQQIFSKAMVAIGAVDLDELTKFIQLGLTNLDFYLANVGNDQQSGADYHMAQDRYCHYQKQNPRTFSSLVHLGFTQAEANSYINDKLFPEVA